MILYNRLFNQYSQLQNNEVLSEIETKTMSQRINLRGNLTFIFTKNWKCGQPFRDHSVDMVRGKNSLFLVCNSGPGNREAPVHAQIKVEYKDTS